MNLENYVCTLEQAQKLDTLLGRRESIFYYVYGNPGALKEAHKYVLMQGSSTWMGPPMGDGFFNAYTSQELEEMITEEISKIAERNPACFEDKCLWGRKFSNKKYKHMFYSAAVMFDWPDTELEKGAQALAEFLIYLLEIARNERSKAND